jgi:hypothetical protein
MASFYGVMSFQYEVTGVANQEEAEQVINDALDRLGEVDTGNFSYDDLEWSLREADDE